MLINISLTRVRKGQVVDTRIITKSGLENAFFHGHFDKVDQLIFIYGKGQIFTVNLPRADNFVKKSIEDITKSIEYLEKEYG